MTRGSNRIRRFKSRFSKPPTQASLFHYIKDEPEESIWKGMDWNFLFHPIRTANEAWKRPRAKPSLFHYVEEEPKVPFNWKEFIKDLFSGLKNPLFIPSVFSDPEGLAVEHACTLRRVRPREKRNVCTSHATAGADPRPLG